MLDQIKARKSYFKETKQLPYQEALLVTYYKLCAIGWHPMKPKKTRITKKNIGNAYSRVPKEF